MFCKILLVWGFQIDDETTIKQFLKKWLETACLIVFSNSIIYFLASASAKVFKILFLSLAASNEAWLTSLNSWECLSRASTNEENKEGGSDFCLEAHLFFGILFFVILLLFLLSVHIFESSEWWSSCWFEVWRNSTVINKKNIYGSVNIENVAELIRHF